MELMPGFWPPKPSRFWNVALAPLRHYYLRQFYGISSVSIAGAEHLKKIPPGDGVLLAPNHSHDSDPHVMMDVGHQLGRQLYFMAAWQVFLAHHGIDGWVMQRFGAFSVDREGCDRRAIRQATELLTGGQSLVVFPEGEIYHTNERLTPLREGVGFMAVTAQRDLEQAGGGKRIWVVPAAIRYTYETDITPALQQAVSTLEAQYLPKGPRGGGLADRIVRVGEALLAIREKAKLGEAAPPGMKLPERISRLIAHLLETLEKRHHNKISTEPVPVRVKALRRHLLEAMCDQAVDEPARHEAHDALEDLHMVLQLYSYPGDYITTKPSIERMAETIEKFEEDLDGAAKLKGPRRAAVMLGEPIDVRPLCEGRPRAASTELTGKLETALRHLMSRA